MFKASDRVNYDKLKLNPPDDSKEKRKPKVASLLVQACNAVNKWAVLAELAIKSVPCHLAPELLKSAIDTSQRSSASSLISNWPLTHLCFREILVNKEEYGDIFDEEMGFDLVVFRGIAGRKKGCKIICVDLRGFSLNAMFCKLIVKMWPILSLSKSQLNPKRLAKVIAETAGVEATRLTDEVFPRLLKDILDHEMVKSYKVKINMPRGQRMIVKVDSLLFLTGNTFFMDYLISNCLRRVTPVHIQTSSIRIRSDLHLGDQIMDSLAPFIVLRGQDIQTLEGLCLSQLEDGIFFTILSDVEKFVNIRFLDLTECSIYLQKGQTRSRSVARNKLISSFSRLNNLKRLDISLNYLIGCLGEVLEALPQPLEYLSLKGCDINEDDLDGLAKSKHALSLRELNLSKLTHITMFDIGQVSQHYLLKTTRNFPNLCILSIAHNNLPDAIIPEFCVTVKENLTRLKVLDISANYLNLDSILSVVQTCARLKTMQKISLTCVQSFWAMALAEFENMEQICRVLESTGRDDIIIENIRLLQPLSDFTDLLHGHLL